MLKVSCVVMVVCFCVSTIIAATNVRQVTRSRSRLANNRFERLSKENKEEVLKLEIFDAETDTDVKSLNNWFCMTSTVDDLGTPDEAFNKLYEESCISEEVKSIELNPAYHSMCVNFELAQEIAQELGEFCPKPLMKAECRAVTMYSGDFYASYNTNIRKGILQPYKVFTVLLYSALQKLDKIQPLPNNTILYRGLNKKFTVDSSGRFYFKQFVSTTLDKEIAEMFGQGTLITIVPSVPIVAARVMNLSMYPGEEEILISPFEAFEFVNESDSELYFKSSKAQDFIDNPNIKCSDPGVDLNEGYIVKSAFFTVVISLLAYLYQ